MPILVDWQPSITASYPSFPTDPSLHLPAISQSRSSPSTSSQFPLKYSLTCPSLIHSYYMSSPFQYLIPCLDLYTAPSIPHQFLLSIFVAVPPVHVPFWISPSPITQSAHIHLSHSLHSTPKHYSWFHHHFIHLYFNCFTYGSRPKYLSQTIQTFITCTNPWFYFNTKFF